LHICATRSKSVQPVSREGGGFAQKSQENGWFHVILAGFALFLGRRTVPVYWRLSRRGDQEGLMVERQERRNFPRRSGLEEPEGGDSATGK